MSGQEDGDADGEDRFVVDGAESELGILDLTQVFVESLDRAFENVCELDLIFHFDEVSVSFCILFICLISCLTFYRSIMFWGRSFKVVLFSKRILTKSRLAVGLLHAF